MNRWIYSYLLLGALATSTPSTLSAAPPELAPDATAQERDDYVEYWVEQLGHDQYLRRERASKQLIEAGPEVIPKLVEEIRNGDLEIIERATNVVTQIAISKPPNKDGGAWKQLNKLAVSGAGRSSSCASSAIRDIRKHRARQAREALSTSGIFVGLDEFAIRAISQPRMIVQVDEKWNRDPEALQWLQWLDGVENARVKGVAVNREVLEHVTAVPGLKSLAIVDGEVGSDTLEPLKKMTRIHSLEFRYVSLTEEHGDLISSMPIRVSLNLMGTGISAGKVESMRSSLPGLQIDHRQGGFLGVTCIDGFDVCKINGVLPDSAAEEAGLIEGDVIVQVGDSEVKRFKDLQAAINEHVPGDEVEVRYRRAEKIESVKLRLRRFEES